MLFFKDVDELSGWKSLSIETKRLSQRRIVSDFIMPIPRDSHADFLVAILTKQEWITTALAHVENALCMVHYRNKTLVLYS